MWRVVADAGPLHYLVLTGDIALLPQLFEKVLTPMAVRDGLAHARTPEAVRIWIAEPPDWLEIHAVGEYERDMDELAALDAGERAAVALALATGADLLRMDDQQAVAAARRRGFAVTGTLGLLDLAARRGLVDLAAAFARLKATSFYYRQGLLDTLLSQHEAKNREWRAPTACLCLYREGRGHTENDVDRQPCLDPQ